MNNSVDGRPNKVNPPPPPLRPSVISFCFFRSDFSRCDGERSDADVSNEEEEGLGMLRYNAMTSFGSEGSSRSANSQRSRGSFRVFGIKRRTLKMTVNFIYLFFLVPGF